MNPVVKKMLLAACALCGIGLVRSGAQDLFGHGAASATLFWVVIGLAAVWNKRMQWAKQEATRVERAGREEPDKKIKGV